MEFANVSFSGGLSWRYVDSEEAHPDEQTSLVCLIRGRPAVVTEARFGGIVAQPVHETFMYEAKEGEIDLTGMKVYAEADTDRGTVSALPKEWYEYIVETDVQVEQPGIYEWRIDGVGVYIGKYTSISRPTREYERNVAKLIGGKAYRLSNPDGFRRIHKELAKAVASKLKIMLTILENVDPLDLNRRERELIIERGTLNGSAPAKIQQGEEGLKA